MLRKDLVDLAKNAPKKGYIESGNWDMLFLKSYYNKSDYYFVEVLNDMLEKDEIAELYVNYDKSDGHILSYKFR